MVVLIILLFVSIGIIYFIYCGGIKYFPENILEGNLDMEDLKKFIDNNFGSRTSDGKLQSDKIIVNFQGSQYDITDFAIHHPGGKDILIKYNGMDIEKAMLERKHSVYAYEKLKKYKL